MSLSWCLAGSVDVQIETVNATLEQGTRLRLEYTLWQIRDLYATRLGIEYPKSIDLQVTIHGDEQVFRAAADEAGRPSWSGGWFDRRDGRNRAVFRAGDEERLVETFLHEGSHFLVSFGGAIPRWLNEGLAETLQVSRTDGRDLVVTPSATQRRMLGAHGMGPVADLILDTAPWKELPGHEVSVRYVRAFAVATVLMSSSNGADTLAAIAADFRRTRDAGSVLRAIERVYQGGAAGLQRDVDAFCKDPPASVTVATTLKGPLNSDAMWTNCPDGRLVRTDIGCGY